jgi:hypothetical protein
MDQYINRRLRKQLLWVIAGGIAFMQPACSSLTSGERGALLVGAEALANIAGSAAASYYGGSQAGELASAGLSALASVLQGYIGATVPASVVQATPGIANVGTAIAPVISTDKPVSQSDVNTINQAAAIAGSSPALSAK